MEYDSVQTWSLVVLLCPLAGAIISGALGPRVLRGWTHWPAILGVAAALLGAFMLFGEVRGAEEGHGSASVLLYRWISAVSGSWFDVGVLVDPLTAVMLLVVTGISLLVIIYSREYMREHGHPVRGYERFFAYLALFVFSMCTLVLSGNFLLLYLGWEAVGLCSYLLIGFYYDRPSAAAAAKKAFLVNRIGDFGFGLGILLIYLTFNSLDYGTVFAMVEEGRTALGDELSTGRITAIALLLFCGAVGKSAQFPLYVWLPDAMEGPSPVSALIHAATMVTAGVYMVARCGVIFTASPVAMGVVAVIGAFTALFSATIALAQYDMKRILAYSTVSQLGYMFLGLGVYAGSAAIFHLYTHAFFKALLFLAAGSVMHAMGGIIDVRSFGGLRRIMPWTYGTMLVGGLALAGFPLFSGFWSKDEIIHAAFEQAPFLGVVGLLTVLLTAFYTFRMIYLAFHGVTRTPKEAHAHESGGWILVPLVLLAIGAAFAGYVGVVFEGGGFLGLFKPHGAIHHFLEPVMEPFAVHHATVDYAGHLQQYGLMYLSGLLAIIGIVIAYSLYVDSPMLAMVFQRAFPRVYEVLNNKYYVDEAYQRWIIEPLRSLGRLCFGVDNYFIDGVVWLVTAVPRLLAFGLRTLQQGRLQGYAASMVMGLAVILVVMLWGWRS
jgi:NADH-quinone oxidoreductase subunit L